MAGTYNTKNPAVKRILQEMREMQEASLDCSNFSAEPMAEDIFEWQFVIRGPADTEFANGLYHGRILLPPEYPFKPPSFVMLTPSGRFETSMKICLSISSHHPEHWQPSWSMRTALMALIAFFPTPGKGAVGSLDFPVEDRKVLAQKSRTNIPYVSSSAKREIMNMLHEKMLAFETGTAAVSDAASEVETQADECQGSEEKGDCDAVIEPHSHSQAEVPEPQAEVMPQEGSGELCSLPCPCSFVQTGASAPASISSEPILSNVRPPDRPGLVQVLDSLIIGIVVLIFAIFFRKFYQVYAL